MIIEILENFLFFATVFAIGGFGVAWAARRTTGQRPDAVRPQVLVRLYTQALVLPPLAAAWVVAAALLPCWWLGERHFDAAHPAPLHTLHLVGDLTGRLEPALGYAAVLLVAGAVLVAASSMAHGYRRLAWAVERLQGTGAQSPDSRLAVVNEAARRHRLAVALVQSDYPLSFVWGFQRSQLVLSSGLLAALTPPELVGVLEHEAAHHARRDNLAKLGLAVCAYASLAAPLSRRLLRWRNEQVEWLCDEIAASRSAAPLDIAEALVKLRRRTLALATPPPLEILASSFVPDDHRSVEWRVRRLVAMADASPLLAPAPALPRAAAALGVASLFALSLVGLGTWAPLAMHAAAESVLQALK